MDPKMNWKIRLLADELERLHGRAFAEAFLEDYYQAKIAQTEQQRDSHVRQLPPTES
jgi:predicted ArsR family transcriptional regulator